MSNEYVQIVFGLLGGLAIFIYGMNLMSEGLQKAAGEKMRSILALLTKNPLIGVLAGALTTAVLQSSSATSVMAIGFVSAGLMTLPQAISIILGANIGTTMTAQLIAFKIGDFIWPILVIGFILYFFFKKENINHIGQTIFAFGLLFIGIENMGSVMKPLAATQFFADLMTNVQSTPLLGVLVGTLMTVVVQSSSATIAVLQNLASQAGPDGVTSIIGLKGALPILFGDNIGTTITALLATIGASVNAKRTAIAHTVFNVTGTLVFLFIIPLFAKFVVMISPKGAELDVIARQIANAHTSFNILNTLLWLPFIWLLVKIVTKILPGEEVVAGEKSTMYLDHKIINQPVFAIHLATRELSRIANFAATMIGDAKKAFVDESHKAVERVLETEDTVDILQDYTVKYLASIPTAAELTEHQALRVRGLMHVASDIERIGDHCTNIAEFAQEKMTKKYAFSKEALDEITNAFSRVEKMVANVIKALENGDDNLARSVLEQEKELDNLEERLRNHHMERLYHGKCSPEFTVIYTDIIHNIERVGDHCTNIAEAVLQDIDFVHEV
ncbi:Na/Pi cotransporter family protein [Anaerovorax odorimutans]|uniref:Na/Pi cotransporter family protein n=1 Tax=Anaerovorax odorimutans TaxID=109327 RepID=UPI00041A54A9|nr:Na/Pi cotransporter family protein [Anaerovorax odorimutans]